MGLLAALCGSLLLVPASVGRAGEIVPDETDRALLQVAQAVLQLFRESADSLWPGFDLSRRPFILYRPSRWSLLLGYEGTAEGFSSYPLTWPDLGHPARFHAGPHEGLIGQLVFDFPLGELKTVAIAVPDSVPDAPGARDLSFESFALGFLVHETFHQYQAEAFGEIPWGREERYPILDPGNTALASLEVALLMGALLSVEIGDTLGLRQCARRFVAVRAHRWEIGGEYLGQFEGGLETREGTAKYVEVRALDLLRSRTGAVGPPSAAGGVGTPGGGSRGSWSFGSSRGGSPAPPSRRRTCRGTGSTPSGPRSVFCSMRSEWTGRGGRSGPARSSPSWGCCESAWECPRPRAGSSSRRPRRSSATRRSWPRPIP